MDELLMEMRAYGRENNIPIIQDGALEILNKVTEEKRPQRILEIGTAIGYSTLYLLSHAQEAANCITLELNPQRAQEAREFFARSGYSQQISLLEGDAGELLKGIEGSFDLIFIDAAKGQYPDYFRKVEPLLAPEGIIMADNVSFRGYVMGKEVAPRRFKTIVKRLREYLTLVSEENGFETVIYEQGDGLAVSRKKKV